MEQRPRDEQAEAEAESEEESAAARRRSEADLRGALDNDSLSEDELRQMEEERATAEEMARRRAEDYQLAHALDLIKGLAVLRSADQ